MKMNETRYCVFPSIHDFLFMKANWEGCLHHKRPTPTSHSLSLTLSVSHSFFLSLSFSRTTQHLVSSSWASYLLILRSHPSYNLLYQDSDKRFSFKTVCICGVKAFLPTWILARPPKFTSVITLVPDPSHHLTWRDHHLPRLPWDIHL